MERSASSLLLRALCRSCQFRLYCVYTESSTALQIGYPWLCICCLGWGEAACKTKHWRRCFSSRYTSASRWDCPEAVAATTSWSQGAGVLQQGECPAAWRELSGCGWNDGCASCRSCSSQPVVLGIWTVGQQQPCLDMCVLSRTVSSVDVCPHDRSASLTIFKLAHLLMGYWVFHRI